MQAMLVLMLWVAFSLTSCLTFDDKPERPRRPQQQEQEEFSEPRPSTPVKPSSPKPLPGYFRAERDGFSFPNYGNEDRPLNLTPATVEYICGKGSCARGSGQTCVLNGAMRSFMEKHNKSMDGGHCEGMSGLALRIRAGLTPLNRYGTRARTTYELPFNNRTLQSDIAYNFALQATHPSMTAEIDGTPREMLDLLRKGRDSYIIGLYNHDGSNGHAVVAQRVIDDNERDARIEIYDSNDPGAPQYIKVNKKANTWTYADYERGTATSNSLSLLPMSVRFGKSSCTASGDDGGDGFEEDDAETEDYEDDGFDRSSAHNDADDQNWEVVLEGPGTLIAPASAKKIRQRDGGANSSEPVYLVPRDQSAELSIRGEAMKSGAPTSIYIQRRGQVMSIENLMLSKGETEKIKIGANGQSLTYRSEDKEAIEFVLRETYNSADYEIRILPIVKSGYKLKILNQVDAEDGNHRLRIRLKSLDGRPAEYRVEMVRIGDERDDAFTDYDRISIGPRETDVLEYGRWRKDRQPLSVLKDFDSDGEIDKMELANDDE